MAYLKKSKNRVGKCYYSSQIKSVNWSKPLTIALKTSDYEVALERHEEVEDNEKAIKRGIKYSFSWEDMSNRGRARIVKKNVEQLVDQWLRIKSTNVRVETHKRYKISMHSFLNVIGYSSPLSVLNNQCIEKYKEFYKGTNANGGINTNLRGIKCFLLWAYDEGFIKVMPKIKMMPTEKKKPKYINDSDWDRIMNTSFNWPNIVFFKRVFTLYRDSGMRRNEAIMGRLMGNFLIIDAQYSKTSIEKEIPLTDAQIEIVKELHDARDKHLKNGSSLVTFKNKFTKLFKDICKRLEIDASLHSLRHTFAVRRYLETKDLYRVCKELGHTSILTTEIYAKFSFERLDQDFPTLSKVSKIRVLDTQKVDTHSSYNNVSRLWN